MLFLLLFVFAIIITFLIDDPLPIVIVVCGGFLWMAFSFADADEETVEVKVEQVETTETSETVVTPEVEFSEEQISLIMAALVAQKLLQEQATNTTNTVNTVQELAKEKDPISNRFESVETRLDRLERLNVIEAELEAK